MLSLSITPTYGWVVLDVLFSVLLVMFKAIMVGNARKRYGVAYPEVYAIKGVTQRMKHSEEGDRLLELTDADCDAFNCYQRAHQNTLEVYPFFLVLILIGGLKYPITSAVGGLVWLIGRFFYALGYYTGNPQKRYWGAVYVIGFFTLFGCTASFCFSLLRVALAN